MEGGHILLIPLVRTICLEDTDHTSIIIWTAMLTSLILILFQKIVEPCMERNILQEKSEEDCPICLEPMAEPTKKCVANNCGHMFHIACLRTWCNSKITPTCPLCRVRV